MKVKKYEARDFQEAFMKIKADLGNDAIILHATKSYKGGFLGLFRKECVEVLATNDVNVTEISSNRIIPEMQERFRILQEEIKEIKGFIHRLATRSSIEIPAEIPEQFKLHYLKLLENEVEKKLAIQLINSLKEEHKSEGDVENLLLEKISLIFGPAHPIKLTSDKCKVEMIIGPTGSGKTTTIAKLASYFKLIEKKKVALFTIDTYRIGAIEQLRIYAELIEVPLEVIFTPAEFKQAIEKYKDYDLILVDTAGRSQKNTLHMYELKDFINAGEEIEVHLVLSATTKYKDLLDIYEKFSLVPIHNFIFSKMDETTNFGGIFSLKAEKNVRISYITTGQNVPDDIEVPESKKLARLVLGV